MPGVVVKTAVRSGPTGVGETYASQYFVLGTAERGPTDEAKLIRGMSEFTALYGNYETSGTLFPHLKTFFEEGGTRAYVYRVAGAGASAGYLDLVDSGDAATMRITAANPGDWSANVDVQVTAGDAANTFKITIWLDDVPLITTRDLTDVDDAVSYLNTQSVVNEIIVASDVGTSALDPDVMEAAQPLSAGYDGITIVADDYVDGLAFFTYDLGPGAVAAPGQTSSTVYAALIDHANDYNRIALCAFGENDTVATVKSTVAAYYGVDSAEHAAFYYPWIQIPDPATSGLYLYISPESYVAARRAKAINSSGPWLPGAGLISQASYVTGLKTAIDRSTGDGLDQKRINALRKIGSKVRVYGARSVSQDEDNWRYITAQDTINYIVNGAETRLEDFTFQPIDARGALFSRIRSALVGLLDPIRLSGGLYEAFDDAGNQIDPGYSVEVSDLINPEVNLAQGKITAKVGVRVSSVGDQIEVTITKSNLLSTVI